MNKQELVYTTNQNLNQVAMDSYSCNNKTKAKSINSFKNLITRELKNLKSLDQLNWTLSVSTSKQNVVSPLLTKEGQTGNMFFKQNSMDVMENYYTRKILEILQQASVCNITLKELV